MKIFLALLSLAAVALAEENCYTETSEVCRGRSSSFAEVGAACNSKYSSFQEETISAHLQDFAMDNIRDSFYYLLTAANFGNYDKNREGFQSYFQKLSDETWESAIDIIKYIGKRGGTMNIRQPPVRKTSISTYEEFELGAMSNALDITKELAMKANHIHSETSKRDTHSVHAHYDAEVSSYIEEHFVHKHASLIRELSGHTNDLKKMYNSDSDKSLALFMFDEYLKH